jgi:hypothetical protein
MAFLTPRVSSNPVNWVLHISSPLRDSNPCFALNPRNLAFTNLGDESMREVRSSSTSFRVTRVLDLYTKGAQCAVYLMCSPTAFMYWSSRQDLNLHCHFRGPRSVVECLILFGHGNINTKVWWGSLNRER